jgi:hypothetical protein
LLSSSSQLVIENYRLDEVNVINVGRSLSSVNKEVYTSTLESLHVGFRVNVDAKNIRVEV